MRVRAEVAPVLTLAPGWWDAVPGLLPEAAAWALYAAVAPDEDAGVRPAVVEADVVVPPADAEADAVSDEARREDGAGVPAALAATAARALAACPPPGPLDLAARAAAALAARRRAPAPWAEAAAAALGGAAALAPGADGRPGPAPSRVAGPDEARAEAVRAVLARRLLVWRPPQPAAPGWARRRLATSWLAAGDATAPAEPGPAFAGAWAAAPPPAQWEEEALAARIASLWERLRPLHELEPDAAQELHRARAAGAVAALVCDDGNLVAALFPPGERDAAAARLARMGVRAARPRLASTGLVVRVSVAPASSAPR